MTAKQKHLDLKSRYVIEHSLDSSMSFKAIARELGKDCTTISKEIRNHLVFKKSGALGKPFNDCALRFDCDIFQVCQPCVNRSGRPCKFCGRCLSFCISYKKETCSRLSKPPYVCNGCEKKRNCTLEKRFYHALSAQKEYELTKSESRSGFAISETQHIPISEAMPGDLVFFHSTYNSGDYVTHVGIYISPTKMYHAGSSGIGYADLTSSYYQQHLIGAGRIK